MNNPQLPGVIFSKFLPLENVPTIGNLTKDRIERLSRNIYPSYLRNLQFLNFNIK